MPCLALPTHNHSEALIPRARALQLRRWQLLDSTPTTSQGMTCHGSYVVAGDHMALRALQCEPGCRTKKEVTSCKGFACCIRSCWQQHTHICTCMQVASTPLGLQHANSSGHNTPACQLALHGAQSCGTLPAAELAPRHGPCEREIGTCNWRPAPGWRIGLTTVSNQCWWPPEHPANTCHSATMVSHGRRSRMITRA